MHSFYKPAGRVGLFVVTLLCAPWAVADDAASPAAGTLPDWSITLGAGIEALPRYPGARALALTPIPAVDIEYKNRWFAKQDMPLGVYFINNANWSAGLALQYDMTERRASDAPRLNGLAELPMTPRAKLFAAYTLSALTVSTSAAQDVGGHAEGLVADANAIVTLPLGSQWYFSAGPGITWGNRQYQETYFGITPAQSEASGLTPYAAHGGVASDYLSLEAHYLITKHWIASANCKLAQLQGSAAHSPVTISHRQTTSTLTLSYTY